MKQVREVPALPARARDAHKGDLGRVLVVAGSATMLGAAVLCARACMRAGAGLVRVALPDELVSLLPLAVPEATTCERRAKALRRHLAEADAVVVGPGLSTAASTRALVRDVLVPGGLRVVCTSRPEGVNVRDFESRFVIFDLKPLSEEQQQQALRQQLVRAGTADEEHGDGGLVAAPTAVAAVPAPLLHRGQSHRHHRQQDHRHRQQQSSHVTSPHAFPPRTSRPCCPPFVSYSRQTPPPPTSTCFCCTSAEWESNLPSIALTCSLIASIPKLSLEH